MAKVPFTTISIAISDLRYLIGIDKQKAIAFLSMQFYVNNLVIDSDLDPMEYHRNCGFCGVFFESKIPHYG